MSPRGRQQRRRFAGLLVTLVVVAAALGVVIGRATTEPPKNRTADATRKPTREGAVVAATTYLDAIDWYVIVDGERRRRTIERFTTPAAARRLDAELAAGADALRGALTEGPVAARAAILGYRVDQFRTRRAVVSVWGMALFGTGVYGPTTQWSTSRIELVWSGGRWLVASVRSRGGPSPDSPVGRLAAAVNTFGEVHSVP